MKRERRSFAERITRLLFWGSSIFCLVFLGWKWTPLQQTWAQYHSIQAKLERLPYANAPLDEQLNVWQKTPHALEGGAVLIGAEYSTDIGLLLVDEGGAVLHRWRMQNRIFNPETLSWWGKIPFREGFSIHDAAMLPGGDVIFLQAAMGVNNFRGQRIARMDKDSHILWQVPGNYHHCIDIAGSPQRIYTISSRLAQALPETTGNELTGTRYMEDWIESFDLNGKKLGEWSITNAFAKSEYRDWMTSFQIDPDMKDSQRVDMPDGRVLYDLWHPNSVQYLDATRIHAVPGAQEGDLLLSFRGLDAIALLRPTLGKIIWAAKGPWRHQHTVRAEADGYIYMYDNEGKRIITSYDGDHPVEQKETRILRYQATTGLVHDIISSIFLYSAYLGYYQPLSGGNWLISSPQHAAVVVVSPAGDILWQLRTVPMEEIADVPHRKQISTVHYYPPEMLSFLKGKSAP